MASKKILITTPDYPPARIGGISTFVIGIEQVLISMGHRCDVHVWSSIESIKEKQLDEYDIIINAHVKALMFQKDHSRVINFFHGAEILNYSKNPLKKLYKILFMKNKIKAKLEKSFFNIYVSQFTMDLMKEKLGRIDYSKNIVFENCIDLKNAKFLAKNFNEKLILCCFVRDVPHKNIKGVVRLFRYLKEIHPFGATLYITSNKYQDDDIHCLADLNDNSREQIYKASHLNILLSLDHSHIGNVEGYGLTVLEAGKYGVPTLALRNGGLKDSVHEGETGLFLEDNFSKESTRTMYNDLREKYNHMQESVFKHTHSSHNLENYKKLFKSVI